MRWRDLLRLCVLLLAVLAAGTRDVYAQLPPPAELPASYRGGDIDKALKARDWPKAEQLLVAAIEKDKQPKPLLEVLAGVFLVDRRPLNAAIAVKKAEALGALDARSRYTLVLAYVSLGHGDWARPELQRLLEGDPQNVTYGYWMGRVDYDAGQYASAATHFQQVIARDPSFVRAYDNLGLCYEALNQPDQALEQYGKAVDMNRAAHDVSPWPPLNMGTLLRTRGDLKAAQPLLEEAVKSDASLAQGHYQLGMLLEQSDKLDQAIGELTLAAHADPEYPEPYYALARIYRRQQKVAESSAALATFQRLHDARREAPRQ